MLQTRRGRAIWDLLAAARARGRWSCIAAGTSLSVVAIAAWAAALGAAGASILPPERIGLIMRLEGYAFGTGFLLAMLLPWCMAGERSSRVSLWAAFAISVGLMGAVLWNTRPGWLLMLQYCAMVATTYLGALLDPRGAFATSAWWQRVAILLLSFAIGTLAFDTPKQIDGWHDEASVMRLAAFHFTLLALAEWSGIYHLRRTDWRELRSVWRR